MHLAGSIRVLLTTEQINCPPITWNTTDMEKYTHQNTDTYSASHALSNNSICGIEGSRNIKSRERKIFLSLFINHPDFNYTDQTSDDCVF